MNLSGEVASDRVVDYDWKQCIEERVEFYVPHIRYEEFNQWP